MAAWDNRVTDRIYQFCHGHVRRSWHVVRKQGPNQFQFWLIALVIGIVAGVAALLFREAIYQLQLLVYGADEAGRLHSTGHGVAWYIVLVVPIIGGLIVGLILHFFTPDGRVRSVSDVIQGAAMQNGRVERKEGIASAFASLITLGMGGSSGREGPVVHIGAVLSTRVLDWMKADGVTGRDLLGCAVAAAVSASFNAPIAGALFALEVVLRHFAIHAFAPIVVASVMGAVMNRLALGGAAEFTLPNTDGLEFYLELPAFLLLGVVCGIVAGILMLSLFFAETFGNRVQARLRVPRWLRPCVAGALLGGIAIYFPFIIGVGYETTNRALNGDMGVTEAVVFALVKAVALAITYGGRMGGGVFSPALMMGSLTGLAFGLIATSLFPEMSGEVRYYALAGFGGVAAAVLGAPISTTLIVFEMTGDWDMAMAVLVTVSISTAIGTKFVKRSFFLTQLERRGLHLSAGPQAYLPTMFRSRDVMRQPDAAGVPPLDELYVMIEAGNCLDADQTLESAFETFERTLLPCLPVVEPAAGGAAGKAEAKSLLCGVVFHVDALRVYNEALAATAAEEHS